jgi:exodeoxyribonuclease VII small subunit
MARAPARPETDPVAASPAAPSYEAAVGELEQLVAAMEGGQMPLDRLLEGYKRGAELLSFCRARLKVVEDQVQIMEDGALKSLDKPLESGRV